MESEDKFIPYPKTPHLAGSAVVDDDQVVGFNQLLSVFTHDPSVQTIVIQEKVDGSNVSVHFEEEWNPIIQKRSGFVLNDDQEQYQHFRKWVHTHLEPLWELLGTTHALFGEWLWARHSVSYDSLPDFFIAFDIFDKQSQVFLPYSQLVERISPTGIASVPALRVIERKDVMNNKLFHADVVSAFLTSNSKFSAKEIQEGVYIRCESADAVKYRCKLRRGNFVAGRQDFKTRTVNNSLLKK